MIRIGYARVSSVDQDTTGHRDALAAAGCVRIFEVVNLGARSDRPQLEAALGYLNPSDELVVWELDRLGWTLPYLIVIVDQLGRRGVQFVSVQKQLTPRHLPADCSSALRVRSQSSNVTWSGARS